MPKSDPSSWLVTTERGLYCRPGDFYVDPHGPVPRAIVTHAHADHARPGLAACLATPDTLGIMKVRLGAGAPETPQAALYGERVTIGGVTVSLHPAGHVLGSAQVLLEYQGTRVIVTGDFKRRSDPTCQGFEVVPCDLLITEATFGLPVFRHPDDAGEVAKLLRSLEIFHDRPHLIGAYGLGKAQRLIHLLRDAGYDAPIYLHGALETVCRYYQGAGVGLGDLRPAPSLPKKPDAAPLILCPPGALNAKWARRFKNAVTGFASGWMMIRARARQRGVELPLVLSDHADWDELTATILDSTCERLWVTHGREAGLVHFARSKGIEAEALSLVGFEEEGQ